MYSKNSCSPAEHDDIKRGGKPLPVKPSLIESSGKKYIGSQAEQKINAACDVALKELYHIKKDYYKSKQRYFVELQGL